LPAFLPIKHRYNRGSALHEPFILLSLLFFSSIGKSGKNDPNGTFIEIDICGNLGSCRKAIAEQFHSKIQFICINAIILQ
jgi:hypothetical protein